MDEGYIKFDCRWNEKSISMPRQLFQNINNWRKRLYDLELIGVYDTGIGFGNISTKNLDGSFYITGSATGNKSKLVSSDYALVTVCNYKQNSLNCVGKIKASSESLSHAAIYEANNFVGAVMHVHSIEMWNKYINIFPTTDKNIQYGTPDMAFAIMNLMQIKSTRKKGLIVMGGHEEGILSFGKNLDEAGKILLNYFTNL